MLESMGTTTLMSFAEFEQLPSGPEQLELLKGELIQFPPPQRPHMLIAQGLFFDLRVWRKSNPQVAVGDVCIEMGYLMPTDPRSWLKPDVSVTFPNQPGERFFEGSPMIVFEVVSEYDKARELQIKVHEYLSNGAKEVWVLYPETREAVLYREPHQPIGHTDAICTDLLPGFTLPLAELFAAR
jgi:Uma2 family endonuclease